MRVELASRKSGRAMMAAAEVKRTPGAIMVVASEETRQAVMRAYGLPEEQVRVLPVPRPDWGGAFARCRWPM